MTKAENPDGVSRRALVASAAMMSIGGGAPVLAAPPVQPGGAQDALDVRDFGARGDGQTDDSAAFRAALAALEDRAANVTRYHRGGGRLRIPVGRFLLSQTLTLGSTTVILEGEGSGQAGGDATTLVFPAGVTGIRIEPPEIRPKPGSRGRTGADGTIIRGLALTGTSDRGNAIGIRAAARCLIEDVTVVGFGSHGIAIIAGQNDPEAPANANCWQVRSVRLAANRGSGLYVAGPDTNAGLGIAVDASQNGGWGIEDRSFLGNTYVACHTEGNRAGSYASPGRNARTQLLGCYSEPDQPTAQLSYPAIVWGGLHGAGVEGGAAVLDNRLGALTVTGGLYTSGGLGVGNAERASQLGRVVRKTLVYDAEGRPLGYVPIYDRID